MKTNWMRAALFALACIVVVGISQVLYAAIGWWAVGPILPIGYAVGLVANEVAPR